MITSSKNWLKIRIENTSLITNQVSSIYLKAFWLTNKVLEKQININLGAKGSCHINLEFNEISKHFGYDTYFRVYAETPTGKSKSQRITLNSF